MKSLLVYSTRTGNTRTVAEGLVPFLPPGTGLYAVADAPDPAGFGLVTVGYWVDRSSVDGASLEFMGKIRGGMVGLFGTIGAEPATAYGETVRGRAAALLDPSCELVFNLLCRGRIYPEALERYRAVLAADPGNERALGQVATWEESQSHPDARDMEILGSAVQAALRSRGILPAP